MSHSTCRLWSLVPLWSWAVAAAAAAAGRRSRFAGLGRDSGAVAGTSARAGTCARACAPPRCRARHRRAQGGGTGHRPGHPWSLAFLPDGRMLITQRERPLPPAQGRRQRRQRRGRPGQRRAGGRGRGPGRAARRGARSGLRSNRRIYLSFSERDAPTRSLNGTAVARAELDLVNRKLNNLTVIYRQTPKVQQRRPLRLAPGLRPHGLSVRDHGRAAQRRPARLRAGPHARPRQGGAHHHRRRAGAGQSGLRRGRARSRTSGATATATCRARRCIRPPASCGRTSTARRAATKSTSRCRAATTAGPSSATGRSTAPTPRSARARPRPAWSSPLTYWETSDGSAWTGGSKSSIAPSGMAFYTGAARRLEGQPVRRRAGRPGAVAPHAQRQHRDGARTPAGRPQRAHPRRAPGPGRLALPADRRQPGQAAAAGARAFLIQEPGSRTPDTLLSGSATPGGWLDRLKKLVKRKLEPSW